MPGLKERRSTAGMSGKARGRGRAAMRAHCVGMALWLTMALSAAANAAECRPAPPPPPTTSKAPAPAGDDAAILAYDLAGNSQLEAGRRYLTLPGEHPTDKDCATRYSCFATSLTVNVGHAEVLAGRTTRLTLLWSAHQAGVSELAVRLAANGSKQLDWLRPSARTGSKRRLTINVPALAVRRECALSIHILVAAREAGKSARIEHYIDGLELELLP